MSRSGGLIALGLALVLWIGALSVSLRCVTDALLIQQSDSRSYVTMARLLRAEPVEERPSAVRSPVYPLLLAVTNATRGPGELYFSRFVQLMLLGAAGILFACALACAAKSAWAGAAGAALLLLHVDGICQANYILSEGMAWTMMLFLFAALLLAGARGWRGRAGWFLSGFFLALLQLTRDQFAFAGWFMLPFLVLYAVLRGKSRWIPCVALALLGLLLPHAAWTAYLSGQANRMPVVSRAESGFWTFAGKMIAPHFAVGDFNSPAENSIAMLWNQAWIKGRAGAQPPLNEWYFVRQCYPEFHRRPLETFGPEVWSENPGPDNFDRPAFSAAVRRLVRRSLVRNPIPIAKTRMAALGEWTQSKHRIVRPHRMALSTASVLRNNLRSLHPEVFFDLPIRINHGVPFYYRLDVSLLLWGILLLVYGIFTARPGLPFALLASGLVLPDFLFMGLFYQGHQARFKMLTHPGFWLVNLFLFSVVAAHLLRRARGMPAPTPFSSAPDGGGPLRTGMLAAEYWPGRRLGGAERQCRKLAWALAAQGCECRVFVPRSSWRLPAHGRDGRIEVFRLGLLTPLEPMALACGDHLERWVWRSFRLQGDCWRRRVAAIRFWLQGPLVRAARASFIAAWRQAVREGLVMADVLHTQESSWLAGLAVEGARALGIPAVCKEASLPVLAAIGYDTPRRKRWDRLRRGAHFIAQTPAARDTLAAVGIPFGRIHLAPNGVEIPQCMAECRNGRYVLYVGNFSQGANWKAFDVLIEAWSAVHRAEPGASLRFVGGGDATVWRAMARRLGCESSIEFCGFSATPDDHYTGAAFLVLPSRVEGMSNVLLEAQAWGLPAVVSGIPGNLAVVEDGVNGLVVPAGDPSALADALLLLWRDADRRERLGRIARQRMEEQFDIRSVAGCVNAVYRRLREEAACAS